MDHQFSYNGQSDESIPSGTSLSLSLLFFSAFFFPRDRYLETEGEMDNTWRYQQEKLKPHLDVRSAAKSFDLDLPTYGPYTMDYTREGKYLLLGGRKGHVTVLDWATHKLVTEMHVEETVRDVK